MKRGGIMNAKLMGELTKLRHFDTLVICDIGYPIPKDANVIDLSLVAGLPTFQQTMKAILNEVDVGGYKIFDFMEEANPETYAFVKSIFVNQESELVTMEQFRELTKDANLFIRTGETLPASNIFLEVCSGDEWSVETYRVTFDSVL